MYSLFRLFNDHIGSSCFRVDEVYDTIFRTYVLLDLLDYKNLC